MNTAPDYDFYTNVWHGKLTSEEYDAGVSRATAFVDHIVGFNIVDTDTKKLAYNRAVCAAIDTFNSYGYEEVGTFRIGDFSSPTGGKSGKQIATEEVRALLGPSGLLWGGIG